ncbi:MAG: Ig-like domain-containing protein [Bacilli bacterium]|nr:Ig-like domain-containing protein [Bacilli bacterium]
MRKLSLISSIMIIAAASLFGCAQNETSSTVEKTNRIVLNATSINLGIGETFYLTTAYEDLDQDYDTTFTSSDTSIVTVDEDGIVTAISGGNASVEVKKGNASAKCDFTVSLNDLVPSLFVEGISNHYLSLDTQTTFQFVTKVKFGNGIFEPENLSFNIENLTGEGRMDGNTFIPAKQGNLNIKINASFRGSELYAYPIFVEIKESVVFTLKEGSSGEREFSEINLFTLDQYKDKTYLTQFKPVVSLKVDGEDKSDLVAIDFTDEDDVISYDSSTNTISSNKTGRAFMALSYGEYTKEIPVTVNFVYIDDYVVEDVIIDASVGEFPEEIFDYFPDDKTIVKATSLDGEIEYQIQDGKVKGIQSHNLALQQIVLYNSKAACVVTFKAYAKIITKAEDLGDFLIDFGTDTNKVQQFQNDGYYIVANDIDCEGVTYAYHTRMIGLGPRQINPSCGFVGTFDGQGHTIRNLNTPKGGLFLILGNKAVVKNVAFVDAQLTSNINNKFVLATYVYAAKIQNVYINSSSDIPSQDNAMVAACFTNSALVSNCLFEYTGHVTATVNYGSMTVLTEGSTSNDSSYSDVYVVSETPMTVNRAYYCDTMRFTYLDEQVTIVVDEEGNEQALPVFEYRHNGSVKHYLTYNDMKNASNDYSSFDERYWAVDDNILAWKNK